MFAIMADWDYSFSCVVVGHYEKSCPPEPHYHAIKTPKQIIYHYTTTKASKYG
jgi:hypothetical protein